MSLFDCLNNPVRVPLSIKCMCLVFFFRCSGQTAAPSAKLCIALIPRLDTANWSSGRCIGLKEAKHGWVSFHSLWASLGDFSHLVRPWRFVRNTAEVFVWKNTFLEKESQDIDVLSSPLRAPKPMDWPLLPHCPPTVRWGICCHHLLPCWNWVKRNTMQQKWAVAPLMEVYNALVSHSYVNKAVVPPLQGA